MLNISNKPNLAYVVGVALGDGNLSNPNGRAVRLRITCDKKYPFLIRKIENAIKIVAPSNKVSRIKRKDSAVDICCYSNGWEEILGWKAQEGSKFKQEVSVPNWIIEDLRLSKHCLCGLIETDGSIYKDRGYITINFVTQIPSLAISVKKILENLSCVFSMQKLILTSGKEKFTFRIHKNANQFIKDLGLEKK
jgi:hypothetical protein